VTPVPRPRFSILLPTLDGADDLRALLPRLAEQRDPSGAALDCELVAIDSNSTDATVELLRAAGARVELIPRSEFRHGATRNRCAELAHGELLVFLSQDVLPADEHFLAALARPFDDPRVAGVYGRVLPQPGCDPLTARTVLDLPEADEQPSVRDLDAVGGVWRLSAAERAEWLRFNNVASCVRADVFRAIPFPPVSFGEDFAWASRALSAGWRIAFEPRAVAWHAHRYTPAAAYERYRVDAAFHREAHGWRVRPTLGSALRGFVYECSQDARVCAAAGPAALLRHLWRSPMLRAAQVLGQYAGSRSGGGGTLEERARAGIYF
jgi:rhamnosyltransferase